MGTKILFKSTKDTDSDLYVMNTDGSAKVNLTSAARAQGNWSLGDFEWSHDGRKIAFVAIGPDTVSDAEPIPSRVFVMNADGGNLRIVNATPTIYLKAGPRWSPDDRKIMFYADYGEQIYIMSSEGGGETPLGPGRAPVWSPDGTRIAFEQARRVSVMSGDGSGRKDLGSSASNDHSVTWSPDGSRIAFVRDDTHGFVLSNLWCMNADGSDLKNLTNLPAGDAIYGDFRGYSWAPDGSKLALAASIYNYVMDIFLVPVMGGDLTPITGSFSRDVNESPRWSPDGARILFSRKPAYTVASDIYVMNADGSGETALNPGGDPYDPVEDGEAEWQPGS
jgi:Tol biopolymer transport system component